MANFHKGSQYARQFGRVRVNLDWERLQAFGGHAKGDLGVEIKIGYLVLWPGRQGTPGKLIEYPVGGDMFHLATRIDMEKFKFRAHFCLGVDGWLEPKISTPKRKSI